jgi:hypothetical protein
MLNVIVFKNDNVVETTNTFLSIKEFLCFEAASSSCRMLDLNLSYTNTLRDHTIFAELGCL